MKHEHHTAEAVTPTSVNTEVLSWAEVLRMMPRGLFALLLIGIISTASLSITMIVGLVTPTQGPVIWSGAVIALVTLGLTSVAALQATTYAAWKRFTDKFCEDCPAIANKITKAEALEAAKHQLRQEEILSEVLMEGAKDSIQNAEQSEIETLTTEVSAKEAVAQHEMDNELKVAVNELLDKATNKAADAIENHQKHQAQPSNIVKTDMGEFIAEDELSFEFLADTEELVASGNDYREDEELGQPTKRREVTREDLGAMLDEIERQQNGLTKQPIETTVSETKTPESISKAVPETSPEPLETAANSNLFDFFEYAGLSKVVKDFQQSISDTLGDEAASEVAQAVRSVIHTACLPKTTSVTEQTHTSKITSTTEQANISKAAEKQIEVTTERTDIPASRLDTAHSQRTATAEVEDTNNSDAKAATSVTITAETNSLVLGTESVIESRKNNSEELILEDSALEATEESDDSLSGIPQESMDRIKEIYLLFHKNSGNNQQETVSHNVAVG